MIFTCLQCIVTLSPPSLSAVKQCHNLNVRYPIVLSIRGVDKSLARPVRKEATATEDFEFHVSYL
jgi:hypothetical protein